MPISASEALNGVPAATDFGNESRGLPPYYDTELSAVLRPRTTQDVTDFLLAHGLEMVPPLEDLIGDPAVAVN
jgi:hypothetical protein